MKKLFKYTISLAAVILFFAACEKNEPILFQNDESFVAFEGSRGAVSEATDGVPNVIEIKVMAVTLDRTPFTVNFEFSTEDTVNIIRNPAHENDAYRLLNDSKTLQFTNGMGYASIMIETIDDDEFTGNRFFDIVLGSNSGGYNTGTENTFRVTIIDDEHPLNIVLGTYAVTGTDYWGGTINKTFVTDPVEGNIDQVSFLLRNMLGAGTDEQLVYADVDLDEMMFRIRAGQEFPGIGTRSVKVMGFTSDLSAIPEGEFIEGEIDANGNIRMLHYIGIQISAGANTGSWFELWRPGVIWTKLGKSSGDEIPKTDDNVLIPRLK